MLITHIAVECRSGKRKTRRKCASSSPGTNGGRARMKSVAISEVAAEDVPDVRVGATGRRAPAQQHAPLVNNDPAGHRVKHRASVMGATAGPVVPGKQRVLYHWCSRLRSSSSPLRARCGRSGQSGSRGALYALDGLDRMFYARRSPKVLERSHHARVQAAGVQQRLAAQDGGDLADD